MGRRLAFAAFALALSTACAAETEVEKFDGRSTSGWFVRDFAGAEVKGAALDAHNGELALQYERGTLTPLFHNVLLAGLRELRMTLRTTVDATFAVFVEDADGATFNHPIQTRAGMARSFVLRPAGFQLNQDSKVKKPALDPKALRIGYVLLDLGALLGARGAHTLALSAMEVERDALPVRRGPLKVNETVTLAESVALDGDLVIGPGGRLCVTAPRFEVRGQVLINGGRWEVERCLLTLPQRFNHERAVLLLGASELRMKRALVFSGLPFSVMLRDTAALAVEQSEFRGGMTVDCAPGSRVTLDGAVTPGEFAIVPGARVEVKECRQVLLWFKLGSEAKGRVHFPDGARVADWKAAHGHAVRVKDSTALMWGVISASGSDCTVEDSRLLAAGLYYGGRERAAFADLHNRSAARELDASGAGRTIRFVNARVDAWNFYADEDARIVLERCTFGEALGFHKGAFEIRDSVCDGSGGYLGGTDDASFRLQRCRLNCRVIAKDRSTLELEDCVVTGDLHVSGSATVKLIRTRTEGKVEADPGARLIRE